MIDLVFVLTNKLEIQVKDVKKTVKENQQSHTATMKEMLNTHNMNLEIRDKEILDLKRKIEGLEDRSSTMKSDQDYIKFRADIHEGWTFYRINQINGLIMLKFQRSNIYIFRKLDLSGLKFLSL